MPTRIRLIAVVLLLLSAPLVSVLAHSPGDDAGSGQDAPDDPDSAMIVAPGAYIGNLTPGSHQDDLTNYDSYKEDNITKDTDWYEVYSSQDEQAACTSVSFAPDEKPHNETRVHLRQGALDIQLNETTTTEGTMLAMVGPSPSGAVAGLTALDPPRVTEYDFEINVTTLGDVSNGMLDDPVEVPSPCFGNTLKDDDSHEWTFEGEEGDFLFVTFGTETSRMDDLVLVRPDGSEVGDITSGDDVAIGAATLDATGTWTIDLQSPGGDLLQSTADSDYLIGFNLFDDPEEEEGKHGCRPSCFE